MKIDDSGRVVSFAEKPKGADLKAMVSTDATLPHTPYTALHIHRMAVSEAPPRSVIPCPQVRVQLSFRCVASHSYPVLGGCGAGGGHIHTWASPPEMAAKFPYIASMGIYVFPEKDILMKLLRYTGGLHEPLSPF